MRVLVTGGAGFIGSCITRALLDHGHEVTVLDDFYTGRRESVPAEARLVEGSVLDAGAVQRAGEQAQFVIHLAGVVGMRLATAERKRAFDVAVEGTRRVLEATGTAPALLFSSSAVYGLSETDGPSSDLDIIPREVCLAYDGGLEGYATGKWTLEQIGRGAEASGRSVLTVRPFNVVGIGQSERFGMVLPRFVRLALAGEPLTVYDDGEQTRSFSGIGTFVSTVLRLVRSEVAWSDGSAVFNVGTTEQTSIGDLARLVAKRTGSSSEVTFIPYADVFPGRRDVRHRLPDIRRLERAVGQIRWPPIDSIVGTMIQHLTDGGGDTHGGQSAVEMPT